MSTWLFQYNELLDIIDQFSETTESIEFQQTWDYTKKMITAHASAIKPEDMSDEEAKSIAWSQFEATFDEEEDCALLPLAGIVAHLVNAVPFGQSTTFYRMMEVGFSCARGFSREEAEKQQEQALLANPSWELFSDTIEESHPIDNTAPTDDCHLRLIHGGK